MCKYKAGLELARCKSRHLLVWHSRDSLFTQKAHVDQEMQFREKDFLFFPPKTTPMRRQHEEQPSECVADGHFVLAGDNLSPSSNNPEFLLSPEIPVFHGGKPDLEEFFASCPI